MGRRHERLTFRKNPAAHPVESCPPLEAKEVTDPASLAPAPAPETAESAPSEAKPKVEAMPVAEPVPLSAWRLCGEAVTGLAHRRKGQPCQDVVAFRNMPRPILALSDGAGSAAISERGANALVTGISRFLTSLEDILAPWLDNVDAATAEAEAERWSERLLKHALGLLEDLAQSERRSVRDLRATLLLAIIGTRQILWWQVGDGAIVVRHPDRLYALGHVARAKGEFANQTCFVDGASVTDVQWGLLSTEQVFGLAMMSDGGAEKLVSHDGSRVSARIGEWQDAVIQERFSAAEIALVASHDDMN